MFGLWRNVALFSLRLKGPKSQRMKKMDQLDVKEVRTEDQFKDYYEDTLQLYTFNNYRYKNSFSAEELRDASESVKRVFSLSNATPS